MDQLLCGGGSIAIIDAGSGQTITHDELTERVGKRRRIFDQFAGHVVLFGAANEIGSIIDLLALLGAGSTVAALDPATDKSTLERWREAYRPTATIGFHATPDSDSDSVVARPVRPERLLLATSGSTGSPKFVRLTIENLIANATQIVAALGIDAEQRALAHLPIFYSYGLSVLTSHLLAGSSIVLTADSAIQSGFWHAMGQHDVTTLPGVPYSYEMFRRTGFDRLDLPHLRHLTQAGGRMATDRILQWCGLLATQERKLWVMYGQTEATARMSVLPANELPDGAGSVGYAVSGGSFSINEPDENGVGEVLFSGPNVMLGYAESASDVNGSDALHSRLRTGDLGRIDPYGRLWISGRIKRIAKVFGTRVNLDDIEKQLSRLSPLAAIENGDGIRLFVVKTRNETPDSRILERELGLPIRSIDVVMIDELPTTAAGKIDYQELKRR